MPPNWTTPKTWSVGELVTADSLNQQVRDNLEFLKSPPSASAEIDASGDYTLSSSSTTAFLDVNSTTLTLSLTTTGGDLLVHFHGVMSFDRDSNAGNRCGFDVSINGVRVGGDDGILGFRNDETAPLTFTRLVTGLSAGTHTVKLQWRLQVNGGTPSLRLHTNWSSYTHKTHPQFWAREI